MQSGVAMDLFAGFAFHGAKNALSAPARCHPGTMSDFPLPGWPFSCTSNGGPPFFGGFSPCRMIMILVGGGAVVVMRFSLGCGDVDTAQVWGNMETLWRRGLVSRRVALGLPQMNVTGGTGPVPFQWASRPATRFESPSTACRRRPPECC